jgi:hypothetical protein
MTDQTQDKKPEQEQEQEQEPMLENRTPIYYKGAPHIYACNPIAYSASLKKGAWINVRQARMFCTKCNKHDDVTKENIKTLPPSLMASSYDETAFKNSPIYSGQCLRPECEESYKGPFTFR